VCLLALAGFAVATEQAAGVAAYSDAEGADMDMLATMPNAPAPPMAQEVNEMGNEDEDEDEASDEDENENEDEDEGEEEEADQTEDEDEDESESDSDSDEEDSDEADEEAGELSFVEEAANTQTQTQTETQTQTQAQTEQHVEAEAGADARPLAPKAFKFHPERIVAQTSKNEDPEMGKLNLALEAVKEDILATNKQITDERKWVIAVAKIIASYNSKMKRVEAHIIALRKEMKKLYRKKKQIENLKLQKALEAKLKEARDELATLTHSLKHVESKKGELNKSGRDLKETIAGIQAQLAKLRGQQMRKPKPAPKKRCKKGLRYSKKAKKCVPGKKKGAKRFGLKLKKKF